jgi:thiol-disulfide isomerase/thioredoxin
MWIIPSTPIVPIAPTVPSITLCIGIQDTPKVEVTEVKVDQKAMALLEKVEATMKDIKSLSADWSKVNHWPGNTKSPARDDYEVGNVQGLKPNFLRLDTKSWNDQKATATKPANSNKEKPFLVTWAHDGKYHWLVMDGTYSKDARSMPISFEPWMDFYSVKNSYAAIVKENLKNKSLMLLEYLGEEEFEGVKYEVVHIKSRSTKRVVYGNDTKLYIGSDGIVHRVLSQIEYDKSQWESDAVLRNININPPFTPAQFAYTPPTGTKERKDEAPAPEIPLLKNGTKAPNFTVYTLDGKPIKLSNYLGKVVVLDFWATWCGPCMMAMPGTSKVAVALKNKNVVVLGINVWDEKEKFDAWVPKDGKEFPGVVFLRDPAGRDTKNSIAKKLFNVSGIPTQYVIDAKGIIRASFVGAEDSTEPLEDAIKKAQK